MEKIIRPEIAVDLLKPVRADAPGGGWHFKQDFPHEWCWHKDAFSPAELDAIIRIGEQIEQHKGVTGGGDNQAVRDSYVSWMFPNEITGWIFERLAGVVLSMNEAFYRFDLDGFFQGFQFTKYTAPGQHYTWHCDRGNGMGVRKLSLSLQLSDPDDYEGGDLQLKFGEEEQTASRDRGMICLFPSWSLHRVTPVTRGTRYSLVAWVSGPPFK
jgi:PKHD-type hydroxylase